MNNYNIKYTKSDYKNYTAWQNSIINNEVLKRYGLSYEVLGYTSYNYPVGMYSIGYGKYEIFIVAATHGSEVITTDFVMQLIDNIPNIKEFAPNLYTLKVIPIQNPEGFDISSNTYKNIDVFTLENKAYEYYERYKIDNLISRTLNEFDKLIKECFDEELLDANKILNKIKMFVNSSNWFTLSTYIPSIKILNNLINNINNIDNISNLKLELLKIISISLRSNKDIYYSTFIDELNRGFENTWFWERTPNEKRKKLHQEMFKDSSFEEISSSNLGHDIESLYQIEPLKYHLGSQVTYDANGNGINLNANNLNNPGLSLLKDNKIVYAPSPRDNIIKYTKGPIGLPCKDPNNFKYERENIYLFEELNRSYQKGSYLCTLLYHGTGGMIYYEPSPYNMEPTKYLEYLKYNSILASIYSSKTDYKMLDIDDLTGTGDYLRQKYPGVLLIELSKMGGNPLGPYGDIENINRTISSNLEALNELFKYYNKTITKKKIYERSFLYERK